MHVLEILRGLATGGRAVLTTIHQARRSCSGLQHVSWQVAVAVILGSTSMFLSSTPLLFWVAACQLGSRSCRHVSQYQYVFMPVFWW